MLFLVDLAGWADAVATMPVEGPLPSRTVLVPNERAAHALRRELASTGRASVLAGTRFITFEAAAVDVLHGCDVPVRIGARSRRRQRLAGVLARDDLSLQRFTRALLRDTAGWPEAFARTLEDLEAAGLRPADLRAAASGMSERAAAQALDVATVWEAHDAGAQHTSSAAGALAEAARRLAESPTCWPFPGPTLVALAPSFTAVEAAFARALPRSELALFVARPTPETYVVRVENLLGPHAAKGLRSAAETAAPITSNRDLLARYFLAPPDVLRDPARPRSSGPDGSVALEEHAGADAEIDAAVDWVTRQILERQRPLDRIAVLLPHADRVATMLADRLARRGVLVFPAAGRPFAASAAGARTLAILRALLAHLPSDQVAGILPYLQTADEMRLRAARAATLVFSLGTTGGSAAAPERALDWPLRVASRIEELRSVAKKVRTLEARYAMLEDFERIQTAVTALGRVAQAALEGKPLDEIADALRTFFADHVRLPPLADGKAGASFIGSALTELAADPDASALQGFAALDAIHLELASRSFPGPSFGEPAVFVGSIRAAFGLSFDAVRVMGLSEGHWPSLAREDAVLPDDLRRRIAPEILPLTSDRPLAQLQALSGVFAQARDQIVLSMARFDADRSQREPSALFLEAKATLQPSVPDLRSLQRDAFAPARADLAAFRARAAVDAGAVLARVAARADVRVPAGWVASSVVDVARVRAALGRGWVDPREGWSVPGAQVPGLDGDKPVSPSGLGTLLTCPYRFLLERVLYWKEPPDTSSPRALDAATYGSLFHTVCETFYRAHGQPFGARTETLGHWQAQCRLVAEDALRECLAWYPPLSPSVRQAERARLYADTDRFLDAEWRASVTAQFVAAERSFGFDDKPATLPAGKSKLHVRGVIDRIDVEGDRLLVRDLKTGKAHPRSGKEKAPRASVDLQLGVYVAVAREMPEAKSRPVVAAYVYTGQHGDRERAFRDDAAALESATREWIGLAHGLLDARAFPRTPDPKDCTFCPFHTVCGDDFHADVAEALAAAPPGPLAAFRALKEGDDE